MTASCSRFVTQSQINSPYRFFRTAACWARNASRGEPQIGTGEFTHTLGHQLCRLFAYRAVLFNRLRRIYSGGKMFELDGLSVEFTDWWFNVRASNTEPLVRLNLEAKSKELLDQRQKELLELIRR